MKDTAKDVKEYVKDTYKVQGGAKTLHTTGPCTTICGRCCQFSPCAVLSYPQSVKEEVKDWTGT